MRSNCNRQPPLLVATSVPSTTLDPKHRDTAMDPIDRTFAKLLMPHPYGWGLYKQVLESQMQPGDCGYFDDIGHWQRLGRVHESYDHGGNPWEPVSCDMQQSIPETLGPMTSALVDARADGGTVGVEYVPSNPLPFSIQLEPTNTTA